MSRRRSIAAILVWVAAVGLVAALAAAGAGWATFTSLSRSIMPEVVWDAADGTPVPDDFVVVMYPADDAVAVHARADGASERVGTLDRALSNQADELGDEWIFVNAEGEGGYVRRDRLVFDRAPAAREDLVASLQRSEAARGRDPALSSLTAVVTGGPPAFVARIEWSGGSWDEHRWSVAGNGFRPESIARWHEQTVAAQGMGVVAVSGLAFVVVFCAAAVAGVLVVLAARNRRPGRAPAGA